METSELYGLLRENEFNICIDTRKLKAGDVFFALKGPNFNANSFAEEAIHQGAAAVIADEIFYNHARVILVENVLTTLQSVAHLHRKKSKATVIAITGSNGKTSTKELALSIFSKHRNTIATAGNLNNHIGIPITLLRLRPEHEFLLLEMGANHIGEIASYCEYSEPDAGLITSIGKAHLEGFGGIEGVIQGKTELFKYLEKFSRPCFYNLSHPVLGNLFANNKGQFSYGVSCDNVDCMVEISGEENGLIGKFFGINSAGTFHSALTGNYNAQNIASAIALADFYKVQPEHIEAGINEYVPYNMRSEQLEYKNNYIFLDAYNANPSSMEAALNNFFAQYPDNRWIILGAMAELGEFSQVEHKALVNQILNQSFERLLLVGMQFKNMGQHENLFWFENTNDCGKWLFQHWPQRKNFFIKGSRSMRLEALIENRND